MPGDGHLNHFSGDALRAADRPGAGRTNRPCTQCGATIRSIYYAAVLFDAAAPVRYWRQSGWMYAVSATHTFHMAGEPPYLTRPAVLSPRASGPGWSAFLGDQV